MVCTRRTWRRTAAALLAAASFGSLLISSAATASSPSGSPSWTKQVGTTNDDRFYDVDVNAAGQVYATGVTYGSLAGANVGQSDAFLSRYDLNGRKIWTRQFGSTDYDYSTAVATAKNGDTYVVGYTYGNFGAVNAGGGEADVFLTKYDKNGRRKWVRQFGTASEDIGQAIAVVGTDTIYIAGSTQGDVTPGDVFDPLGYRDMFVAKYDKNGNRSWIRQMGSAGQDYVNGIAVATTGLIYVTGGTNGALPGQSHVGSSDGYIAWVDPASEPPGNDIRYRQFGTTDDDVAWGVATDSAGDVYVAGQTNGVLGDSNAGAYDGFVTKYSAAGNEQWTTQEGTDGYDTFTAISAGAGGNVTVTGATSSSFAAPNGGGALGDIITARYDATSGTRRWAHQFGSALDDRAAAIAITPKDDALVVGHTYGAVTGTSSIGVVDAFITKYPASRNKSWGLQIGTATYDTVLESAPTTNGKILIGGETRGDLAGSNAGDTDAVVMRVDASGNVDLQRQIGSSTYDEMAGVGSDAAGNIYVLINTNGSIGEASHGSTDASLTKYDADGNLVWQRMYGSAGGDAAAALAVTPNGKVYIGGWTAGVVGAGSLGLTDAYLLRINPTSGDVVWSQQFGTAEYEYLSALAASPNGDVFVAGQTNGPLGRSKPSNEDADSYVARFDLNGNRKWVRQFGGVTEDDTYSIAVNAAGDAVVAGAAYGVGDSTIPLVRRYDRNGRLRWERRFFASFSPAPGSTSLDIALDRRGNAYVVGGVSGTWLTPSIGQDDAFLVRLDRNGRTSLSRRWGTTQFDDFTTVTIGAGGVLYAGGSVGFDNSFAGPAKGQYDGFITRIGL